uniref:CCHC-type domain-containing protein n=1 Tax=Brassica oleracea var. oleracea TaxID=109376 RepID=A0A0D3AUU4_BRAOL
MLHKAIHAIRQLKKKGNTNISHAPKQQTVKPTSKAHSTRCFKCHRIGHYGNKCQNQKPLVTLENNKVETEPEKEEFSDLWSIFDDYAHEPMAENPSNFELISQFENDSENVLNKDEFSGPLNPLDIGTYDLGFGSFVSIQEEPDEEQNRGHQTNKERSSSIQKPDQTQGEQYSDYDSFAYNSFPFNVTYLRTNIFEERGNDASLSSAPSKTNMHGLITESSNDICSLFDSYLPTHEASTHEITWRMCSTQLRSSRRRIRSNGVHVWELCNLQIRMFGLLKKSKPQQDVYFPFKTVLEKEQMIFENKKQFASNGFDFVQKQMNQRKRQNRFDGDAKWVRSGDRPFTKTKRSNRDVFNQNELQTYVSLEKMLHKAIHAIRQLKKKGNTNISHAPKQQKNPSNFELISQFEKDSENVLNKDEFSGPLNPLDIGTYDLGFGSFVSIQEEPDEEQNLGHQTNQERSSSIQKPDQTQERGNDASLSSAPGKTNMHGLIMESSNDIFSLFDSYLPTHEASTHEITLRMCSTQLRSSSKKNQIKRSSGVGVMQFANQVISSSREFGPMFGLLKKSKPLQDDVYFPFKTVVEKKQLIFDKRQFASNEFDSVQKQRKRQNRANDEKWVRSGDRPFTKTKRRNRDVFDQNELQTHVSLEKMLHKAIHAIRQLKKKGNTNTSHAPNQQINFSSLSNSDLKANVLSSDKSKAVKPTSKAHSTRCFKCHRIGHYGNKCQNQKPLDSENVLNKDEFSGPLNPLDIGTYDLGFGSFVSIQEEQDEEQNRGHQTNQERSSSIQKPDQTQDLRKNIFEERGNDAPLSSAPGKTNMHGLIMERSNDICSLFDSYLPTHGASTNEITWRMCSTQLRSSSKKNQIKRRSGGGVMQFANQVISSSREFGSYGSSNPRLDPYHHGPERLE